MRWMPFAGAFAIAVLSLAPPADTLADRSFAWHMVQHLTLFFVVPLLLLLSRPFALFRSVAGKATTARFVRATRPLHFAASAPVALVTAIAVLWGTHYSPLYESALEVDWMHASEHALYLLAGTLFWLPVLDVPPLRPNPYAVRLFYLIVALPQGALLALALNAARVPLYPHYAAVMPMAAALRDQQDAAAIMWIASGLVIFVALLATMGAWAARENRAAVAGTVLAVLTASFALRASADPPAPSYADDQARKGQTLFYRHCAECHGATLGGHFGPALAGGGDNVRWATVSYVWQYMTAHMPAGNAGGLTQTEYLDVMAFLLESHGRPAGKTALTPRAALESKAYFGP
ncbi:MAG: cytochrome c oxidase assembly protein [Candidatus Eremiobacteraeota bacterium]|nr:cytochrome c oxidase assembly protein [Candidatus Eremiobacteraeota bacterium]